MKLKSVFVILAIAVLTQGCRMGANRPLALPATPEAVSVSTETQSAPSAVPTIRVEISTSTATIIPFTPTPESNVTVSAVNENIFIRRGPDMAYNPIDI